jgi:hypothetical protein
MYTWTCLSAQGAAVTGGGYQEGGALYALGLINAEHGSEVRECKFFLLLAFEVILDCFFYVYLFIFAAILIWWDFFVQVIPYLIDCLRNNLANEVVQHGACLALGLAAFATGNETVSVRERILNFFSVILECLLVIG